MTSTLDAGALFIGPDGLAPLPWLEAPLSDWLARRRGHALLMHAGSGQGALALGVAMAQSLLCEAGPDRASRTTPLGLACGRCAACHLTRGHAHPDLFVLMPETLRRETQWPLPDDKPESDSSRTKPSKWIRIDDMRWLIERLQRTSGRGRGKVALIHPAQALNETAANALLKTLEEPPAGTTLLLTVSDPGRLLPTVRSRCQIVRLATPGAEALRHWLATQGVERPEILLAAAGGQALDALALHREGVDAAAWEALPRAVTAGQGPALATLAGWGSARAVDTLLKLGHDALGVAHGAMPRFFPPGAIQVPADRTAVDGWIAELQRVARHAEHPWNEPLLLDTLLAGARSALAPARSGAAPGSGGMAGPGRPGPTATLQP